MLLRHLLLLPRRAYSLSSMKYCQYELVVPASVKVGRKKYSLNLNIYRNLNPYILNQMKRNFTDLVKDQLDQLPKFKTLKITYVFYHKGKRLIDVSNFCSIVDKFFSDALVEAKIIKDDNYTIIPQVVYAFGTPTTEESHFRIKLEGLTYENQSDTA